jgi:hypothetical protein
LNVRDGEVEVVQDQGWHSTGARGGDAGTRAAPKVYVVTA